MAFDTLSARRLISGPSTTPQVVVSPAVASRLAEVFDDPDEFRPGRWLESKPKHEQFTFGFIGSRRVLSRSSFAELCIRGAF